jgi:hypothetical protein
MKPTLLLLLSFSSLIACNSSQSDKHKTITTAKADTRVYVYHFQKKYFDLNALKFRDTVLDKSWVVIKSEVMTAPGFAEPADSVVYKNRSYKLLQDGDITISENGKYVKTIPNEDKKLHMDNVTGNSVIYATTSGIVHALRLTEQYGYHITKYDADGNLLNKWTILHTLFIKHKPNEIESVPYLYFFGITNKEIVFSTVWESPRATVILNMRNGNQQKLDYSITGMILGEDNDTLLGVIANDSAENHLLVHLGNKNWQIDNPMGNTSTKTILKDSILYVAMYPDISSGCDVFAFNAYTGKQIWKGDVIQMNIPHSKYYNTVYLTLFHDKLILEGIEAGGQYLQILDSKNGKRLFSSIPEKT